MPRKLKQLIEIPNTKEQILELCRKHKLNKYETEILLRIYWKKQSITYVAFFMDFKKYGKTRQHYSVRTINNYHKAAIMKILRK